MQSCYKCTRRKMNCHADCPDYNEEKLAYDEIAAIRNKNKSYTSVAAQKCVRKQLLKRKATGR